MSNPANYSDEFDLLPDTEEESGPAAPKVPRKKERRPEPECTSTRRLISLMIIPLTLFFLEVMIRLTVEDMRITENILSILAVSFAYGSLLNAICCMIPNGKVSRWILVFFQEAAIVWFLVAFFTDNAYNAFMPISSILTEAGNVVTEFGDNVVTTLRFGFVFILLYHIPVVLTIVFNRQINMIRKPYNFMLVPVLLVLTFGFGLIGNGLIELNESAYATYTTAYNYDNSMRQLGVLTTLQTDIRYTFGDNSAETEDAFDFDVIEIPSVEIKVPQPTVIPEAVPSPGDPEPETTVDEPTDGEGLDPDEGIEAGPDDGASPPPAAPVVPKVYGYHTMDIDFDTLLANTSDSTLKNLYQYVQNLTPARENKYTGLFEGKNLILITAEAFAAQVIDPERTPTLYRLAHQGILFEDFYQPAWGGSTSTGEYSFVTGLVPAVTTASMKTAGKNMYFTMGNQLQREGYYSAAYHNGTVTYYSRDKTHTNWGYSTWMAMGNGMENGVSSQWPESDLEMIQYTLPMYIDQQPFSIYYMSISGHASYAYGSNAMAKKNQSVVEGLPYSYRVKAYLACNQELENALNYLIAALEEAGIADDTVIAICPDHYPYGLDKSATWNNDVDYLKELYGYSSRNDLTRDQNAAIIWCGCMEDWDEQIVISEPSYSLDLLPTLSNLFGLEYDSRLLVGRDVLGDEPALVLWNDYSWKTTYGYYTNGRFYPADGYDISDDYVKAISAIVKNKISFSKNALSYDLYAKLFGPDDVT